MFIEKSRNKIFCYKKIASERCKQFDIVIVHQFHLSSSVRFTLWNKNIENGKNTIMSLIHKHEYYSIVRDDGATIKVSYKLDETFVREPLTRRTNRVRFRFTVLAAYVDLSLNISRFIPSAGRFSKFFLRFM